MKRVVSLKPKALIRKVKRRYVGSCWSSVDPAFQYSGRKVVALEDRTVNLELLCSPPAPAPGLPHHEQFTRTSACSPPSCIPELLPCPNASPSAQPQRWGVGTAGQHHKDAAFFPKNEGCSSWVFLFYHRPWHGNNASFCANQMFVHSGCSLPTLSVSGLITTVWTSWYV